MNRERELTDNELDAVTGGFHDASKNEVAIEGLVSVGVRHPAKVTVPDVKLG
jgi:bacteriocin-like protein